MAAQVQPLVPLKLPVQPNALSRDDRYWQSFTNPLLIPSSNSAPVTYISSNTTSRPNAASTTPRSTYICVTSGARLQLFSPQTLKVSKSITRTTSPYHSAHIRRDGRVCISGSDTGVIQAFDTNSRSILKTWTEHKQPVWVTKWHPSDLTGALSCSDDRTVRMWDLPNDQSIWQGRAHQDYVRAGTFIGDGAMIATGGYDQTIRIWDTRIASGTKGSNPVTFKMPAPVESILALNSTTLVGSAGHQLAVLDLVANRPLGMWSNNHQKTITSIAVASNGTRVLTGALDGHVKVWDTESWKVVAGLKYSSPILSLDITVSGSNNDDKHLCVGMQSGVLSIKTRTTGAAKAAKREKEKEMAALLAGTIDQYDAKKGKKVGSGLARAKRGMDFTGEGADIIIDGRAGKKFKKLNRWESLARQGDWNAALTEVIKTNDQLAILTMLTHMQHRSSLRRALAGRPAKDLVPVMNWLIKRIKDPKHMRLKTDLAMLIVDMYGSELGRSEEFDKAFERLLRETKEACETSQMCVTALGMFGLLETDAMDPGAS